MKYTYIDLFAGCGGISDGFESSEQYQGLAHVEWELAPYRTLIHRLKTKWNVPDADKKVLRFDIQKTHELMNGWNNSEYGNSIGLKKIIGEKNKVDVIVGGPPCQAYSIAGRVRDKEGMQNDYRNNLFESYIEVLKHLEPDLFVFENVPGILTASPGGVPIVDRIHNAFENAGYATVGNFKKALLHLNEFGVPQKRSRVIIIGLRKKSFINHKDLNLLLNNFYEEFKKIHKSKEKNAFDAIGDLPKILPNPSKKIVGKKNSHICLNTNFLNHTPRFHNKRDIDIFKLLTKDIETGKNKYKSVEALKKLYTEKTGKKSEVHKYNVIKKNEPSNTIPAHLYKDGLRHIHWDSEQARSITVREAARLQTFDDDFEFIEPVGENYKMIGNAVPPLFSRKIAISLVELLKLRSK
jgi:DNA (cytosine-5)-methyltransferase 1